MIYINWLTIIMALTGALIVTSRYARIRLWAFGIWMFTNAYWIVMAQDNPLKFQFAVYFVLAIIGFINNRKAIRRDAEQ